MKQSRRIRWGLFLAYIVVILGLLMGAGYVCASWAPPVPFIVMPVLAVVVGYSSGIAYNRIRSEPGFDLGVVLMLSALNGAGYAFRPALVAAGYADSFWVNCGAVVPVGLLALGSLVFYSWRKGDYRALTGRYAEVQTTPSGTDQ